MVSGMRSTQSRLALFIVILLGLLLLAPPCPAIAQTGEGGWSVPAKIYEGQGTMSEPALAADQMGILHAFWKYLEEGSPSAIFYARWNSSEWSQPVDVVATSGSPQGPSAVVDRFGMIHLIWQGPGNALYYSSASVEDAHTASGWTEPVLLVQSNAHADIKSDAAGTLYLVYPGLQRDGVYCMISENGGGNWMAPSLVASPVKPDATTEFVRLSVSPDGDLHVVWSEFRLPLGMPALGVFYARSDDRGQTWSRPYELADEPYLEANIVAVDENTIHVAWNAPVGLKGRYHRWSGDGGATWSNTNEIASPELGGGSTNPPALSVDSAGTVHVVVNTQPGGVDATMYTAGRNGAWLPLLDLSHAAPEYIGLINEASALAITRGHLLHVLFVDNDGARIWHTYKSSSASVVPATPFTPLILQHLSTDEAEVVTPRPAADKASNLAPDDVSTETKSFNVAPTGSASLSSSLIIGILPAAVLVGGVMLYALSRRRTH